MYVIVVEFASDAVSNMMLMKNTLREKYAIFQMEHVWYKYAQ